MKRAILLLLVGHFLAAAQTGPPPVDEITALLRSKEFGKAVQLLRAPLQRSPQDPRLWTLQGMALTGEQRKSEALASFRHALALSPEYLPALEGAAQLEYETGGREAPALLQRVLKQLPQDPTTHAMLAVLAYKHNNCTAAVSQFEQSGALLESQPVGDNKPCPPIAAIGARVLVHYGKKVQAQARGEPIQLLLLKRSSTALRAGRGWNRGYRSCMAQRLARETRWHCP
jgi:tetratricopeptide (TPR) repeat protein